MSQESEEIDDGILIRPENFYINETAAPTTDFYVTFQMTPQGSIKYELHNVAPTLYPQVAEILRIIADQITPPNQP